MVAGASSATHRAPLSTAAGVNHFARVLGSPAQHSKVQRGQLRPCGPGIREASEGRAGALLLPAPCQCPRGHSPVTQRSRGFPSCLPSTPTASCQWCHHEPGTAVAALCPQPGCTEHMVSIHRSNLLLQPHDELKGGCVTLGNAFRNTDEKMMLWIW